MRLFGAAMVLAFLSGCVRSELAYTLNVQANKDLDESGKGQLAAALTEVFGTPRLPSATGDLAHLVRGDEYQLASGAASYRRLCMHCHGITGDGNGATAAYLNPKPRDYRRGVFKFTSTAQGQRATRSDLRRTLKNGIPGTSMPSFRLYSDQEIESLLDYVILLSVRGEAELSVAMDYSPSDPIDAAKILEECQRIVGQWKKAGGQVVTPAAAPPVTDESVARGKELFLSSKAQCYNCHGKAGRGDGLEQDPQKTTDVWGNPARPADLVLGFFHGGRRPVDLYRRIHAGIKGTPMPAQQGNLNDEQIWDLVNYVNALARSEPGTWK